MSDYLIPWGTNATLNSFLTSTIGLSTASENTTYPYGVRSTINRTDLLTRLGSNWKGLLPNSLQSNDDITAVGALTVNQWQTGWNNNYSGDEQITVSGNETNGYSALDVTSKQGYNNTLYFPHKSVLSYCYGYWLDSIYSDSSSGSLMFVYCLGYVRSNDSNGHTSSFYGVRPAVHLSSDIPVEQDSSTGVWKIAN